jgi:hypothetical protein
MSNPADEIMKILATEIYLNIAIACLNEPKTASQIADAIGHKLVNVGMWIKQLEYQDILRFTPEGWKTSNDAAAIIKKYFA